MDEPTGGEGAVDTDRTADVSSRQLMPASFFCATSPYPARVPWRRLGSRHKRSRAAAPDKPHFELQGEVTRKVNRVLAFSYPVLCTAEGT